MEKSAIIRPLLILLGVGAVVYLFRHKTKALQGQQQNQPGTSQSGVPQYDPALQNYFVAPYQSQPNARQALPSTTIQGNSYGGVGGNQFAGSSFTFGGSPMLADFSKNFTYNQAPLTPSGQFQTKPGGDCGCGGCSDPCATQCPVSNNRFIDGRGVDLAPSKRQQMLNTIKGGSSDYNPVIDTWTANVASGLPADPSAVFGADGAYTLAENSGGVPAGITSNILYA